MLAEGRRTIPEVGPVRAWLCDGQLTEVRSRLREILAEGGDVLV